MLPARSWQTFLLNRNWSGAVQAQNVLSANPIMNIDRRIDSSCTHAYTHRPGVAGSLHMGRGFGARRKFGPLGCLDIDSIKASRRKPFMSSTFNPAGTASVTPLTTSPIGNLLNEWASLVSGEWTMSFSPSTAPTASALGVGPFVQPSGGNLAATRILGGKAVEASFNLGGVSGKTTVSMD